MRKLLLFSGVAVSLLTVDAQAAPACLVCDLPLNALAADSEFNTRVQQTFPKGAKVADMKDALGREKFQSDFWHSRRLVYRRQRGSSKGGDVCGIVARVDWSEDGAGYVSAVEGHFLQTFDCTLEDVLHAP